MSRDHFFTRSSTDKSIAELATIGVWVVYAGLGTTIDQTGLSWADLVKLILYHELNHDSSQQPPKTEMSDINAWVKHHGPQRAASTAEALIKKRRGKEHWESNLASQISDNLYDRRRSLKGELLSSLAAWTFSQAERGGSVLVVTPNYDEHLYNELSSIQEYAGFAKLNPLVVLNSSSGHNHIPSNWRRKGTVTCVHIHGYVPENYKEYAGIPALGEITYQHVGSRVASSLATVLSGSNVLTVGTSLADPEIVNALVGTSSNCDAYNRLAILPLQGSEWHDDQEPGGRRRGILNMNESRLSALGLSGIYPDYYGQVSQLIYEAIGWMDEDEPPTSVKDGDLRHYEARLAAWWDSCKSAEVEAQRPNHKDLIEDLAKEIRPILGAGRKEGIRVELWLRCDPNAEGKLRVWCSSDGEDGDLKFCHQDIISLKSRYDAIKAFCAGSPQLFSNPHRARWKHSYAFPLWNFSDKFGIFVVGVVVISSMPDGTETARGESGTCINFDNLEAISRAASLISDVALEIAASCGNED